MRFLCKLGGVLALAIVASSSTANAAKEAILYRFQGNPDGREPEAPLIRDAAGNLYGTASGGGESDEWGNVFKITPKGKEIILHSFTGGDDGGFSTAGLIADAFGNLYGTTGKGGAGKCGTVFKLMPSQREKVVYAFTCGQDGEAPSAGLVMDSAGNLYGTTIIGGLPCAGEGEDLCGTVFKLTPSGRKKLLYAFAGGNDGMYPNSPLIRDSAGNLYGTTTKGGGDCDGGTEICGVVFKVTRDGQETIVHAFGGPPSDGYLPAGGLIADEAGNLYGMTVYGGAYDEGTVYKITPDGQETVLHSFTQHGTSPWGEVVRDSAGNLFGVTNFGGATGGGSAFKLTPKGREVTLHSFSGENGDGLFPYATPILDDAGNLYGTTVVGGSDSDAGTVFRISTRQ